MNVKLVSMIVLGIAVLGLLLAPAALAYSDALKGATGGEKAQAASPTMKVSPMPKKITPTPIMKMQVRTSNATPGINETPPARHSYIQGVPKSDLGEPLGIGTQNVSALLERGSKKRPTE
ncbi:hypothetical protein [Methanocella sp. MCL-LM]|uniref:hypothetical protein n=1 Tax=Methanocella sp. MCL-LM TaxID=3412035 RepID=UPI003C790E76